ncbi:Sulfate transporter membrane protein [Pararobbsia alpina]|uniref:SulP family inorganic anion transporter n=1 Tax=Pararobbsia alpina TaxID=621374 RepID=UPI0039A67C8D
MTTDTTPEPTRIATPRERRLLRRAHALVGDLTAGTVSTLVMLCYAMSLGTLVFSADLARYADLGVPTALISCVVTAFVIALTSSLRFSIGGPDSNATAFLAGVAAGVASSVRADGGSPQAIVLTVLISIAVCSVVTGVILYAIGSSKRGRSLQFVPYPVVGGFLAGTGYLLLAGAFRVMTGHAIDWQSVIGLANLSWLAWLPAIAVGAVAMLLTRTWRHPAALPITLMLGVVMFYILLSLTGRTIDDARSMGLLLQHAPARSLPIPELHWPTTLTHGEIDWAAIVRHLPETLVVTSVSAITILMNSTAIGAVTGRDIDVNRELRAAGLASLASGLLGGMIGYQSYNRSMLNARSGATTRVAGLFAALVCLALLVSSPGIVSLFPVPVLVGLQIFMGLRLLVDWLFSARRRLDWHEYWLVPLIVVVIAFYGVVAGVVVGVVAACVTFALLYGRISCIRSEFDGRTRASNVERPIEHSERLRASGVQICGTCLQGFLFFGSASALLQRVRERVASIGPAPVRFVVIDFAATEGMDASVSLSFVKLRQTCASLDAVLVLTALPPVSRALLERTGTLDSSVPLFDTLDAGLEWIEARCLLCDHALSEDQAVDLRALLAMHFSASAIDALWKRFTTVDLEPGAALFRRGDQGDALYLVERGRVCVSLPLDNGQSIRLRAFGPGTIVGEMALYTERGRSADVMADRPSRVLVLTREALVALENDEPLTAQQFHRFVVKVMASRLAVADEALRVAAPFRT